ncbi:hypothetical protein WA556_001850, partial [Blastocystis sp. ATCC 50177/Nand II]
MGNGCFKNVGVLKLIGLKKLEKVIIGEKCFTQKKGSFTLKECDALRELKIGNGSFNGYPVCEIDSLNSLEVIEIGGFRYASDFQLKNLPELTSLVIGCGCLQNVGELKLIGLKKLE